MKQSIDPAALNHMLAELRLPTITALWPQLPPRLTSSTW